MPKITRFSPSKDGERVFIHLDGEYAVSVRERVFAGLGLSLGLSITAEEIRERDSLFWKTKYGKNGGWEREKLRLDRVTACLVHFEPRFAVNATGFGAGSLEFIARHPEVSGAPDLEITDSEGRLVACVEVTGTETMRGSGYWVRPDKIDWARKNPDIESWVGLHYAKPKERLVFFRPDPARDYPTTEVSIGGTRERFVVLGDADVIGWREFGAEIRKLADRHFSAFSADSLAF